MAKHDMIRKHADKIGKAADGGAVMAGYGWWYFIGIFAVILVVAWVVAVLIGSWVSYGAAILVTLAILPPLVREWRRRDEVGRAMGRAPKR
ncbi:MAG: hypothetical protein KDB02_02315 [Acidimicrobiales bacterium]|nr:hypothetical protein [Acidimicrobiales bacterium]